MASRKPQRPRDPNQLAKRIIDLATGEAKEENPDEGKDPAAVKRGHLGGIKGGKARAEKLTPAQRKASATKAARSRWSQT